MENQSGLSKCRPQWTSTHQRTIHCGCRWQSFTPRKSSNKSRHQNPVPVMESSWKKSSQRWGGTHHAFDFLKVASNHGEQLVIGLMNNHIGSYIPIHGGWRSPPRAYLVQDPWKWVICNSGATPTHQQT